ncbi:AraC family transcriptional regulator, partial [Escherichia coli]
TSDCEYSIEGGVYALFRYTGKPAGYSDHINNIYLNALPFYGLR